jgi:hypothetical protein
MVSDVRTPFGPVERPFPWLVCGIYAAIALVAWVVTAVVVVQVADGRLDLEL